MIRYFSRRDPRYSIASGCGTMEYAEPNDLRRRSGLLKRLTVSGLCYEIVIDALSVEIDTILGDCTLHVGSRAIQGEVTVKDHSSTANGGMEYGGLFYPASARDEKQLKECIESLRSGGTQEPTTDPGAPPDQDADSTPHGLYVRCGGCHRAEWLESPASRRTCDCGEQLSLGEFADPESRDQLGDLARQLGRQEHIDLPAAYSVIVGLMTLEQALELCDESHFAHPVVPQEQAAGGSRGKYDPAFEDSVSAGLLSPGQAYERGRRREFAQKIVERHGIQMEQAYAVADNRTSLLSAIRASRRGGREFHASFAATSSAPTGWRLVLPILLLVIAGLVAWNTDQKTDSVEIEGVPEVIPVDRAAAATASRSDALRAATVVRRDDRGRAVQAVGPDPRSVLIAFCESLSGSSSLEAIDLTSSYPPTADARLGIVRDLVDHETFVVHIRKDPASLRWYTGDGVQPLTPVSPSPAILEKLARR